MQNNCGILAYDQLVGQLNGRTNNISLDSLAKIAQDNGFILFPMRVPLERMKELRYPYIIHHNHHFETWESEVHADVVTEPMYVLSAQCIPELVVTETEARGVKGGDVGQMLTPPKSKSPYEAMTSGSTGGWASGIGPTNPTNPNDPKGNPALQWVGPALDIAAGAIPGVGPLISTAMGAGGFAGGGTGFQGTDKGWGNVMPTLLGAGMGYGEGMLGSGISGAIGNEVSMLNAPTGAYASAAGQGAGEIYPGVSSISGSVPGGLGYGAADMGGAYSLPEMAGSAGLSAGSGTGNIWSNLGTGFNSGMGSYLNTPLIPGLQGTSGSGIGTAISNLFTGGSAPATGGATATTPSATGFGSNALNSYNTAAGSMAGPSAATATGTSQGGGFGLGGLVKNPATLLGLGLMGASAIPQTPSYQQPSSVQDLRNQINSGGTALGQQTQSELSSLISNPVGSMFAGEAPASNAYAQQNMALLDQSMQQDMSTLDSQYAAAGMGNSGEHNQARQQLMDKYAQQKQDMLTTLTYQNTQSDITSKMSALSQASGMDQNTLNDLAGLTGLDVTAAATKYSVDANSINSLRQMLGTAGTLLTAGGMGLLGGR